MIAAAPLTGQTRSLRAQAQRRPGGATSGPGTVRFEPNQGQSGPAVQFLSRGAGYTLYLMRAEALLLLEPAPAGAGFAGAPREQRPAGATTGAAVHIRPVGALPEAAPRPRDPVPGHSHYLIGTDPDGWVTDVPGFARVEYRALYPGVDLVYYGNSRAELEYDFHVAPGGDPGDIELEITGADGVTLAPGGDLHLRTAAGELIMRAPDAYQEGRAGLETVSSGYALRAPRNASGDQRWRIGFSVGSYDRARRLIIDPVVRYLSTPGNGFTYETAVDAAGHAYVTGFTTGLQVTPGALQGGFQGGTRDAFVTKLDAAGGLVHSTYLGGAGDDEGRAIALDPSGHAYVVGLTLSTDFPTVAASQPTSRGGHEAFVAKLNDSGSTLELSTYLGGAGEDFAHDVAVGSPDALYVTGVTTSPDFPVSGAFQSSLRGSADAWVVSLSGLTSQVRYASYLGGSSCDAGWAIDVDAAGAAYVTGQTNSADFPTVAAAQAGFGGDGIPSCNGFFGGDAFVAKVDPGGGGLAFSTFLGGGQGEIGNGIAVDAAGSAHVAGRTDSADLPLVKPIQPTFGGGPGGSLLGGDAFVARLDPAGSSFLYVTYLGGGSGEAALDVGLDASGHAYVTGFSESADFPTASAFQPFNAGVRDAFIAKLEPDGQTLSYSSYLGEGQRDGAFGLAVSPGGDAYPAGVLDG